MSKIIRLTENQFSEMMAYHGTGADFDKFNHKKFLSTGMHSQSFGWGTYVTDDKFVAKGYSKAGAESFINKVNGVDAMTIAFKLMKDFGLKKWTAFEYADEIMDDLSELNFKFDQYKNLKGFTIYSNKPEEEKEKAKICLKVVETFADKLNRSGFLYEVDIPDDNGTNYIEWYEQFPKEFMKRVINGVLRLHNNHLEQIAVVDYDFRQDLYKDILWMKNNPDRTEEMMDALSNKFCYNKSEFDGGTFYKRLSRMFVSDKAASLFLMQCGFDGIKYPAGTRWGLPNGAEKGAYNYVIFDANKVKIINKTKE